MTTRIGIPGPHPKHVASFRGVHNSAKSRVLITLYSTYFAQGGGAGASYNVQEIHRLSGVNLTTIQVNINRWWKWGYVSRRAKANGQGRPAFYYWLGARGKAFVETRIPSDRLKEYVAEIQAHRAKYNERGNQ